MGSITVLVVDEDPEVLDLTATFLEREDAAIEVRTETAARAAIDRVAEEAIDAVVTDLRMPEIDGVELAERIAQSEDLPVFLFTGADPALAEDRRGPVEDVIQKGTGTDHFGRLAAEIETAVEG